MKLLLYRLTFALMESDADWQRWWDAHRSSTRLEWAVSALQGSLPFASGLESAIGLTAVEYLNERVEPQAVVAVEAAVNARAWTTRIAAAYATRFWNPERSQRLLARELQNRHYRACQRAAELLEGTYSDERFWAQLARPLVEASDVDCRDPESRARAFARWVPQ